MTAWRFASWICFALLRLLALLWDAEMEAPERVFLPCAFPEAVPFPSTRPFAASRRLPLLE